MTKWELAHYPLDVYEPPSGWTVGCVGDVISEAQPGFASGGHNSDGRGIPHLRPMNVSVDGRVALDDVRYVDPAGVDSRRLHRGDILFNNTNSPALVGKTALVHVDEDMAFSNHMTRLRVNERAIPAFVAKQIHFLFLKGYFRHQCKKHVNQASIGTRFLLDEVPFVIPPIAEQHRIAAHLDTCFDRTKRAKAALDEVPALVDRLRQSILAAAFRGDLTADWRAENPDVEPASELLKRIRIERRRRWEEAELAKMIAKGKAPKDDRWKAKYEEPEPVDEAELPELPEGWCWTTIETVGHLLLGRRRADAEYVVGDSGRVLRQYLRVANVKDDRIDFSDLLEMGFSPEELETYRLLPGDILLSEGQSLERVGQGAVFRGESRDLCLQATLHRFRAYPGLSFEFAQLVFMHHVRTGVFRRAAAITTNIAHLTSERLRPLPFPLAPSAEQTILERRVRAALDRAEKLVRSSDVATGLIKAQETSVLAAAFSS